MSVNLLALVVAPDGAAMRQVRQAQRNVATALSLAEPEPLAAPKAPERFKPGTRFDHAPPRPKRWAVDG